MLPKSALLTVIVKACDKAAKSLIRDFNELEHLQVSQKGPADYVTHADIRTEKLLREELLRARPKFGFLGEESGEKKGESDTRFIVDPIDGTLNFMHGIPHFCISVGVQQGEDIIAGLIYDPIKQEIFWAEKDAGAFCNGRRLQVARRKNLNDAVLSTGVPTAARPGQEVFARQITSLLPKVAGIRRMGSAALDLAYVAAGRFDGYWENHIKIWDMAAGILIVTEAGGKISDAEGSDNMLATGCVVASNPVLHGELLKLL